MRTINTRFLAILVGSVVVLTLAVFGVHALQSNRIAGGLRRQAERAEEQGQADVAARFLSRYLEMDPDDNDARARLGRILADRSEGAGVRKRERALFVLEQVLIREPERINERLLLVPIALGIKRFDLAAEHLSTLHQQAPDNGAADELHARWHRLQNRPKEAAEWYRKSLEHAPERIETYLALADLIRRTPGPDKDGKKAREADKVIDSMVSHNDASARAHLARWEYGREWRTPRTPEEIQEAGADVTRAQELDPDGADTLLARSELADIRGEATAATQLLRDGLRLFPSDVRMYRAFAGLELRSGHGAEAAACFRDGAQRLSGEARQDLLWAEANVRVDLGQAAEAEAVLEQMRKARCPRPALEYINGRLLILAGRWSEAAQALERLRPLVEDKAELVESVDLFLGRCFEQLGEPVRQHAAYQRAINVNPNSVPAREGLIQACVALGRVDEALEQSAGLMQQSSSSSAAGWLQVARLCFTRNLNQATRDWQPVNEALDRAEKLAPESVDVPLLRAEAAFAQGQTDRAREVLEQARKKKPTDVRFLTALAELADRSGKRADADKLLTEANSVAGDSAPLRAARARCLGRHGGPEGAAGMRDLCKNLDRFSEADRAELLTTLAEESHRVGNLDDARRLWSEVAAQPRFVNDLRLRLQLFQMATRAGDEAGMQNLLREVERIEHGHGPCWHFCEAIRLIEVGRKGNREALDEAGGHLNSVAAERPSWPAVLLAKAEIELQKENWEAAVANYHRAIDLGGRNVGVTRQLVQALIRCRRFAEAEREVRQLQSSDLTGSGLGRLAAELSLRNQEPALAVKTALETVSADSADYRDHVWLGQVLATANPGDENAEKHLRRAVALAEQAPETWVALVQYLASTGRPDEAKKAVAEARKKVAPASLPATLAPCHEALQQLEDAGKYYKQAAEEEKSATALHELARFYIRTGRAAEAEAPLRKILAGETKANADEATQARRELATLLAGLPRRFAEALGLVGLATDSTGRLIEKTKLTGADAAVEQRFRARVLASGPTAALRNRAVDLLEDLAKRHALGAEDRFLLAHLYVARGARERARDLSRELITAEGSNPAYLAYHAQLALTLGQVDDAERCAEKLAQIEKQRRLEPNAIGAVELRAQVLELRGKTAEAIEVILPLTKKADVRPEHLSLLIGCQAREKRFAEALENCARAWAVCAPEMAARISVAVVRTGAAEREQVARVDGWMAKALAKNDKPTTELLLALADFRDFQGKYADAEEAYRKVLAREPDNCTALNNLAWLLAAREANDPQTLELINRAIEKAGPQPELLDTRAFVQLALKNHSGAREDLEKAAQAIPSATHYFHLARTHGLANDLPAAAAALNRARAAGLDPAGLHPLERPSYQRLVDQLPQR
jgi:tetratricopeptide (TPR) repeat protein